MSNIYSKSASILNSTTNDVFSSVTTGSTTLINSGATLPISSGFNNSAFSFSNSNVNVPSKGIYAIAAVIQFYVNNNTTYPAGAYATFNILDSSGTRVGSQTVTPYGAQMTNSLFHGVSGTFQATGLTAQCSISVSNNFGNQGTFILAGGTIYKLATM
ncbi:MAG: hypothetical protein EOP45_17020 [Sphingobacteriaceae bacterium]|nr:MAG: hypothetical protein EOP45_17020 [Sphingobacteriaceae bacterium]